MTLDHKQQHLNTMRAGLSVLLAPIHYLVDMPVDVGNWISENVSARQALLEENTKLRAQHLLLQAQIQKNIYLREKNRHLQELMGSSIKVADRVLIAELFKVDLDPYKHLVRINKGSSDNTYVDQPLLDAHGVMGQLIEVNPVYSTARLITDPNHIIPVQVNRNGMRTLAAGTGSIDRLELPYLPNNADIKKGDLLVTSGLGLIYPQGYPVARVAEIIRDPGRAFAEVIAIPTAHLDRSREVLLVWSAENPATDTMPETKATTPGEQKK